MTRELPVWFEITALVVVAGILLADLVIVGRRPHIPPFRESLRWVGLYVGLALAFAALLFAVGGTRPGGEFLAGWLTEYSLSLDNLFVFALIMTTFAVPRELQQRTLMIGILIALVLRAVLILVGASLIERFTAIFYLFGAILLVTAIGMLRKKDEGEFKENVLIRVVRRLVPVARHYDGTRWITRITTAGVSHRALTPMALVILTLGTTDLLFALDSIPAIFGLTHDPFIVFTANVFALMGLRQLYFMLGGLMERLAYLTYGLAAVLAFIGVKLVFEAMHTNSLPFLNGGRPIEWAPEIPTAVSLAVIVGCLVVAGLVSVIWPPAKGDDEQQSEAEGLDGRAG